jgi:hypothetical protein
VSETIPRQSSKYNGIATSLTLLSKNTSYSFRLAPYSRSFAMTVCVNCHCEGGDSRPKQSRANTQRILRILFDASPRAKSEISYGALNDVCNIVLKT